MKLAILISGRGSNMLALHHAIEEEIIAAEIALILSSNKNAPGLEKAQEDGLPTAAVNRESYETIVEFEKAMVQRLEQHDLGLIVLAGFMHILSPAFVEHYRGRIINIHPSLLPKYKGIHTHRRVIEAGDQLHGLTIHYVMEDLDSGPIILQKAIRVREEDTEESLANRVLRQEHRCLVHTVRWFVRGEIALKGDAVLFKGQKLPEQGIYLNEKTSLGKFPFH